MALEGNVRKLAIELTSGPGASDDENWDMATDFELGSTLLFTQPDLDSF